MNEDSQRERAKLRLFSGLITIANLLNIPIIYESKQEGYDGKLNYSPSNGEAEIKLFCKKGGFPLKDDLFFPYLLAHELGHYFCCRNKLDQKSEQNANRLGCEICNSILTSEEQSYLRPEMDMYFIVHDLFYNKID